VLHDTNDHGDEKPYEGRCAAQLNVVVKLTVNLFELSATGRKWYTHKRCCEDTDQTLALSQAVITIAVAR
jgi:hypothetical protein